MTKKHSFFLVAKPMSIPPYFSCSIFICSIPRNSKAFVTIVSLIWFFPNMYDLVFDQILPYMIKCLSQGLHSLNLGCTLCYFTRLLFLEKKHLPQWLHWYGISPVCIHWCFTISIFVNTCVTMKWFISTVNALLYHRDMYLSKQNTVGHLLWFLSGVDSLVS